VRLQPINANDLEIEIDTSRSRVTVEACRATISAHQSLINRDSASDFYPVVSASIWLGDVFVIPGDQSRILRFMPYKGMTIFSGGEPSWSASNAECSARLNEFREKGAIQFRKIEPSRFCQPCPTCGCKCGGKPITIPFKEGGDQS